MSGRLLLYHAGYQEIREPDIRFGRRNADFGQGFYTTEDSGFAMRWAKDRRGSDAVLNVYELDTDGLNILRFERNAAWMDYIFSNRAGGAAALGDEDIITGPVANDTIYDTFGIITSGILNRAEALRLLRIGPVYRQTVIKSERAAAQLRWISARKLDGAELAACRAMTAEEEKEYQTALAQALGTV